MTHFHFASFKGKKKNKNISLGIQGTKLFHTNVACTIKITGKQTHTVLYNFLMIHSLYYWQVILECIRKLA